MKLIIIGGGDNAGAVIDVIKNNNDNMQIIGISDNYSLGSYINGYAIKLIDEEVVNYLHESKIIISYAKSMKIRKRLYENFTNYKAEFVSIMSKSSYISDTSNIGQGCIIMPGVVIRNQTSIGYNTLINSNATVEHGCQVGNHCHIGPGAVLTGNVIIEDECFIGANSTILPDLKISKGCIIGAGSVVTKNVSQNEIWIGNPARKIKANIGD